MQMKEALRLFFGCIEEPGHYLFSPEERVLWSQQTPWGSTMTGLLDGLLAPENNESFGEATLHHKDGWTALAFWDRSLDSRPGSNGVFLSNTHLEFNEAIAEFILHFPSVSKRVDAISLKRYCPPVGQE